MDLKISGLKVKPEMPNERDGYKTPLVFPRQGTKSQKIIEALEAEPATTAELSAYVGIPRSKVENLINGLRSRGLVRHRGESQYELVDPEAASLAYIGPT